MPVPSVPDEVVVECEEELDTGVEGDVTENLDALLPEGFDFVDA